MEELYGNILYVKEPPKPQIQVVYSNREKRYISKSDNTEFILMDQKTSLLYYDSINAITQMENEVCSKTHQYLIYKKKKLFLEFERLRNL